MFLFYLFEFLHCIPSTIYVMPLFSFFTVLCSNKVKESFSCIQRKVPVISFDSLCVHFSFLHIIDKITFQTWMFFYCQMYSTICDCTPVCSNMKSAFHTLINTVYCQCYDLQCHCHCTGSSFTLCHLCPALPQLSALYATILGCCPRPNLYGCAYLSLVTTWHQAPSGGNMTFQTT